MEGPEPEVDRLYVSIDPNPVEVNSRPLCPVPLHSKISPSPRVRDPLPPPESDVPRVEPQHYNRRKHVQQVFGVCVQGHVGHD